MNRPGTFLFPFVAFVALLPIVVAGCGGGGGEAAASLASPDPAVRAGAVKALCVDGASRTELVAAAVALAEPARLEVLHAAAAAGGDCLGAFPPEEQTRYWLTHPEAMHAEGALAALGAAAEPALVAALAGTKPGALRAARAVSSSWAAVSPATRAALLAALPALIEAGLEIGTVAVLGDAAFAALAAAPGEAAAAALGALWAKVPEERRALTVGPTLAIDLRVRPRYALGSAQWLILAERAPSFLPDIGKMWLRTTRVTVYGDGKEIAARDWPAGHNLGAPAEVQLELGALAGAALTEEGKHELELVFAAQIVAPGPGGRIDTAPVLWSGELRTPKRSFEVVRVPPAELVSAVSDAASDPRAALAIRLHAGGKSVDLLPAPAEPPVLDVPLDEPRASLKATAGAPLPVGLAMELVARVGKNEQVLGRFGVDTLPPGPAPRDLTPVDLGGYLKTKKPVKLTLSLRPSDAVAYRHPAIERYWGDAVPLGEVTIRPVAPAPTLAPSASAPAAPASASASAP